ncbi:MAG: hypothetical protein Q8S84_07500 [bacterium]|nr:hypothetical protein [bacterium]
MISNLSSIDSFVSSKFILSILFFKSSSLSKKLSIHLPSKLLAVKSINGQISFTKLLFQLLFHHHPGHIFIIVSFISASITISQSTFTRINIQ